MTDHISKLKIDQKYISVFASGNSLLEIPDSDIEEIYSKSFLITMNYGPIHYPCHMNIWSDKLVTDFMVEHFKTHQKDHITLARFQSFNQKDPIHRSFQERYLNYTYDTKIDKVPGCYTIVFLLTLLKRYFPDKKILVFGLDGYADSNDGCKWYDYFTNWDLNARHKSVSMNNKIRESCNQLNQHILSDNMYNCNLKSRYDKWEKKNFKEILL